MKEFRYRDPMLMLKAHQKLNKETADDISLEILIALDAAKRGKAPHSLANSLTEHVLAAIILAARAGNRAVYDKGAKAWQALLNACERPTQTLDLTTGEYQAIRTVVASYINVLPNVQVGTLIKAYQEAGARLAK